LNDINLEAIAGGSHGQADGPGRFTDALSVVDVNQAKAFFFNVSGTLLWIKNGADLLKGLWDRFKFDRLSCQLFLPESCMKINEKLVYILNTTDSLASQC